ncbi:MAG TPA: ABC transporter permease [Clostridium sp.]
MYKGQRKINIVKYYTLPILIIIIWEVAAIAGWITPYTMPAPHKIILTAWELIKDFSLIKDVGVSVIRVLGGFVIAAVLGIIIGVLSAISKDFELFTEFIMQVLKPIPPIAWIPIAILWFGIGETSKVFIIFVGAFFPIFVNVIDGIRQIEDKYVEVATIFEVPKLKFIKKVVIPGAMPSIMTGLRIGLGNAWICVVAAEMIAATQGIGYMLMDGRSLSQPDKVILGMLMVGIIGKAMDDALKKLEVKLIYWRTIK